MIKKLLVAALLIGSQNFSKAQVCAPPGTTLHTVDCTTNGYIDEVSITGTSLSNSSTGCGNTATGYSLYQGLANYTAALTKTNSYFVNVTTDISCIVSVWFDYNQNNVFEASEWTQLTTASTGGVAETATITIPASANSGPMYMRIRARAAGNANGSADACTTFGSGETEDYSVTVSSVGGVGCIALSQYPSTTITGPTTTGQNVVITDINVNCNYSGEFSVVTLTAGNYTLNSTTATDIFTITDASNNILFNGVQPFTFSATAGTYRIHVFQDAVCTTNSVCRGVSITRNGVVSTPPTVTTTAITAITASTATSGGNVTNAGSASVTARGICYGTTTNPTTANTVVSSGSGTGAFTANLTGLSASTTYYVRAYATSTAGTSYGSNLSFTTAAPAGCIATTQFPVALIAGPTTNGQTVQVALNNFSGEYYEVSLVAGSFSATSSIATDYLTLTTTTNTILQSSVTPLVFSVAAGTYRVHVFKNAACITESVSRVTEITKLGIPTVTTTAATAITSNGATAGGNVTSAGTGTVSTRGVCYGTAANPTIAGTKVASGSGTGVFSANITGLTLGTLYHMRAYATNASGTSYGADLTFTTLSNTAATVTTTAVTAIATTTATSGGNVTSIGGSAVTSRGICYATTTNPTLANTVISGGAGAGTFISNLTGLNPNTMYYIRAYATNTSGTTYGNQVTFTTSIPTPPTVTTAASPLVSFFTANVGGNVTNAGTSAITNRGVCYSTSASPTIANSFVSTNGSTGAFTVDLLGLAGSTTYHYRAYATNSVGTSYGADLTFTTLDPCVNSTEVYLTNLAFMDLATANATPTYYSTYVVPNAQGLPGLPTTLNYNPLNPYNLVNPGLPVRMKVKSYNNKTNGTSVVSGLCKLRTTDPNITILDSTAGLNNVGWHNEAWSTDEFEFQVSYSVFTSYTAYVEVVIVEGANQYYTRCIPIPIRAFTVGQMDVDDDNNPDSNGNNNDLAEPNEIVEFLPYINNSSTFSASYVAGFVMNFDYLSNVSIWDNHIGSSGNVYAQGWWNYSFAQPQPIPAGTNSTLPEYDFVFDYTYLSTYRFDLHLMMAGGFNLLDAPNNITLMRTSTPLTFNANYPVIPPTGINAIAASNEINVYPNPFNNEVSVRVKSGLEHAKYTITNTLGSIVASGYLEGAKTSINLEKLAAGLYNLTINGQSSIKISKK